MHFCRFKQAEIHFLKDYTCVTKPVAQALNDHSNAYIGYLAPTIFMVKEKLLKKSSIPSVKPVVNALLSGLHKRFN